jgi:hypothetical protein
MHRLAICFGSVADRVKSGQAGHWICDTLGVHVLIPEYPGQFLASYCAQLHSGNPNING